MFVRNTDTGKWSKQVDSLSKDNYDSLKQDLEKTRLYSKCLSGSTYLPINSFTNIYETFDINKIGYYINQTGPHSSLTNFVNPTFGPKIAVNTTNQSEFYTKYLYENAFTIKNLFTPTKLIKDQIDNYLTVDLATTVPINDINATIPNLVIDGVRALEGHRILLKDQGSEVSLATGQDPEVYFSTVELVTSYSIATADDSRTFFYYNQENGIYVYTNNKLVRTDDLDTYEDAYRYSVVVKLGLTNRDRQFHLERLKNGYFPVSSEGDNLEFVEKKNWVLRNRVDYNNIFDLNFYDIIQHSTQSVYVESEGFTYSIPSRTIVVGEFGAIINNQDRLGAGSTFSVSNIISNKFKVNLRSIVEVEKYYWCCGDEGTLLKISKHDYNVERIELDETANLKSISFFGNLYGKVVGEFNTIWWTRDAGRTWTKLRIPEFESYSYNKVVFYDLNRTYVGGDSGVFIEFNFLNNSWFSYKRKVAKQLSLLDEYILVEDINDLHKTDWVIIEDKSYTLDSSSVDFGRSLTYNFTGTGSFATSSFYYLNIKLDSDYFTNSTFLNSIFVGAVSVTDSDNNNIYTNPNYSSFTPPTGTNFYTWDFYLFTGVFSSLYSRSKNSVDILLPIQSNGNLKETTYNVNIKLYYNYDGLTNTIISSSYISSNLSVDVDTRRGDMLLMAANNSNIICYDIDNLITNSSNQFLYFTTNNFSSDVRTITRKNYNSDIFISADKIHYFNFGNFQNTGTVSNTVYVVNNLYDYLNSYVNRILFRESDDKPFLVGNNSYAKFLGTSSFIDLDPTFNNRFKSKLLFLDYDVASKLNFFTDDGEYRLPTPVKFTFEGALTQSLVVKNISGEKNWLNYYKDAEKTFTYYSSISEPDKVEFSTTFSYSRFPAEYTIPSSQVTSLVSEILPLAPTITSATFSRFISKLSSPIASQYSTNFSLLLNKYLLIIKISPSNREISFGIEPKIGEVIKLTSDVIDCDLVINRIERYLSDSLTPSVPPTRLTSWPVTLTSTQRVYFYVYCYSEFNDNIIKNLQKPGTQIQISNLNKFENVSKLSSKFEQHPVSIGYSIDVVSDSDNSTNLSLSQNTTITISSRFNNKTAYYNLQSEIYLGSEVKQMKYLDSFLNFGFSPTYNILDYLQKIKSDRFTPLYKFAVMPDFRNLPGNGAGGFASNNLFVDLTVGVINNVYRSGTNQILFGKDFEFHWNALFLHTFVDVKMTGEDSTNPGVTLFYITEKLLITKKYYKSDVDGYVIEFNKNLQIPQNVANTFNVSYFDITSRNTLQQISDDLQTLNNIQRSSTTKSIQDYIVGSNNVYTFTNLQSELIAKFPTDSYFKILVSDYNIREFVTGIIYTDNNYEIALNILNVESEKQYKVSGTGRTNVNGFTNKLVLVIEGTHELQVGDLIDVSFYGGSASSEFLNPSYHGLQTIIFSISLTAYNYIVTSVDFGVASRTPDVGTISFIKRDPFLNYIPIDLFDLGIDKKVSRAIEVKPENYVLQGKQYNLENVDLNNFRYRLVDGLSLDELSTKFSWILEAEISDAIIGKDINNGLVWYSGTWHCGRWFGGTWNSGRWISGDWYKGEWNSYNTTFNVISVKVDDSFVDNNASRWYGGRWYEGTWSGGTWYNGRRYSGDWKEGLWYDGIWNDGNWKNGRFEGGVWVLGTWETGVFNCDSKVAYWLDGAFKSGDFENGIWYNGQFGNEKNRLSRFGTKSTNSRNSLWHSGRWVDGEFHSNLNLDTETGLPKISEIHKYSIWRTGLWSKGNFYGGIAYNIDFRSGNWHGGILEEIQVVGVDPILPSTTSTNSITVNGIFKFNPGDEIWIIDDYRDGAFSPLGSNDSPKKYRINKILENQGTKRTKLFLNFNLSSLNVDPFVATQSYSNVETGLRVVSFFKDTYWKSGLWTNGIFDGGQFDTGIWYNGIFNGTWGN